MRVSNHKASVWETVDRVRVDTRAVARIPGGVEYTLRRVGRFVGETRVLTTQKFGARFGRNDLEV